MPRGYRLPEQLTDHDLVCVQFCIPDDIYYKAAFFGAVGRLKKWYVWERTNGDERHAAIAANYWKELLGDIKVGNCGCGSGGLEDLLIKLGECLGSDADGAGGDSSDLNDPTYGDTVLLGDTITAQGNAAKMGRIMALLLGFNDLLLECDDLIIQQNMLPDQAIALLTLIYGDLLNNNESGSITTISAQSESSPDPDPDPTPVSDPAPNPTSPLFD